MVEPRQFRPKFRCQIAASRRFILCPQVSMLQHLAATVIFIYSKYALVKRACAKYAKLSEKNFMVRGRPKKYPVKKVIGFDQEMLDAIDEWRRRQKPIPTVSDAIRALVQQGLKKGQGKNGSN
jgi:hypothetical protein